MIIKREAFDFLDVQKQSLSAYELSYICLCVCKLNLKYKIGIGVVQVAASVKTKLQN